MVVPVLALTVILFPGTSTSTGQLVPRARGQLLGAGAAAQTRILLLHCTAVLQQSVTVVLG